MLKKRNIIGSLLILALLAVALVATPATAGIPDPEVDFSAEPRMGPAPLRVQFTDETNYFTPFGIAFTMTAIAQQTYTQQWDFGDGGTSTAQNPSHTYRGPGTYTVSLTVTPEYNCDSFVPLDALWDGDRIRPANAQHTETKELYIIVTEPAKEYEEYQEAEPASMNTCYMTVSATQVLPGQEVIITSNVCNNGGEKGSHTAILRINGNQEQSQSVGVSPGACKTVIFKVAKSYPGTYQVSVDGQQGQFTVMAPVIKTTTVPTPAQGITTAGIIVIVIIGIVLVIAIVFIVHTTKQP